MKQSSIKQKYTIATPAESANHLGVDGFTCKDNWWSDHRFDLLSCFLSHTSMQQNLLDFGCGNGLFLRYLIRKNYNLSLTGYDPFFMNYKSDLPQKEAQIYTNLNKLNREKFDFVTALDVVEHIEDDREALTQIGDLLKTGGTLMVTVPAYQQLFSMHDAAIGHYRRYTRHSITKLLEESGFSVSHSTYFFSFLIPLAIARKYYLLLQKMWGSYHCMGTPVDPINIFSILTNIEIKLLRKTKFHLPCGTSIFVSAHKV